MIGLRPARRRWAGVACVALLVGAEVGTEVRADDLAAYDCGTLALYHLLRLEGRPVALADLEARLPAPSARGCSMKELRDAARGLGLSLEGVLLEEKIRAPDRPALAYLNRGQHGHFLAIRPVGHLGRMVQVFDGDREAEVVDLSDLAGSEGWTGLVLRPTRPDWPLRVAATSAILAAGLGPTLVRRRLPTSMTR